MKRLLTLAAMMWTVVVLAGADQEREARAIETMLVAPCCFSQQVSEHQSEAADEVRRDVRARLAAAQTRQEILDAYVAQYGKRILAEPPARGFDAVLYVLPAVTLVLSAGLLAVVVRRFARARAAPATTGPDGGAAPPDPDDEARLDDELRDLD
jgi:cytochrome c-type biogenesis protein CcmH